MIRSFIEATKITPHQENLQFASQGLCKLRFSILSLKGRGKESLSFLREFAFGESGMTLPLLAISFMAMTGFVGTAIDIARFQLVQSRLSFALDAAGLAAGSTMNTTNINTELAKYMNVNFPAGYLGAAAPTVGSTLSSDNLIITLSASTTMPTTFMNAFGITSMSVSSTSQITRTASGLELVMVLDNTGSMSSSGKLTALKTAATSLVNILFGGGNTAANLWIGLVPFSQAVNIGTSHTSWMDTTYNNTLNWGPTAWMGCVDARTGGQDITDNPPATQLFRSYYWPDDSNNNWITRLSPLQYASGLGTGIGPNKGCAQQVTPMTANKITILNAINAMQAQGYTHIGLGAVWGWRMLSPRWRGLWDGEMNTNALPLNYGTEHMNKAVVILTDGENTMDNNYTRTAYWYLRDGRLGTTTSTTTAVNKLNTNMTNVCTSLKNNGIYVYTIALGNPGSSVQTLLRNCASAPNYYFNSPSSSELQNIFNAIADSLSNLRISK